MFIFIGKCRVLTLLDGHMKQKLVPLITKSSLLEQVDEGNQ